ncbi:DUF445 domain-containing protein [Alteromonas sp. ASW11-130]|uniref:DUF445 domain-containing protein n=1 Tax=Alteromonas sp. ASW11-130 TaxID=3015775 RepID=UPI002241F513|nr:DUF445 domain-containing protein [Alteromonas sp. ASW11-130]MCW8091417.1 DUF445 domain-containing protein [Alteromonas sp. ASW11-130]
MDQSVRELALKRSKRRALGWLIGAASLFLLTSVLKQSALAVDYGFVIGLIKMSSEAALVGGLADWFAVTALFKPIPARWPIPHTNIVANNKSVIAENLSAFVKEKFFNPQAIEMLIAESKPAQGTARWLKVTVNAAKVSRYVSDLAAGALNVVDDKPIQAFLIAGFKRAIYRVDLGPLAGGTLNILTRDNRHQEILNQIIHRIATVCEHPDTQAMISLKLHEWMRTEHRRLEKFLPSAWLSEKGANIAVKAISSMIVDINEDPKHPVRTAFDDYLHEYIERVRQEPELAQKLDDLRAKLLENPSLHKYLTKIWDDLNGRIKQDLNEDNGHFRTHLTGALINLGKAIDSDPKLAASINRHIAEAGRYMAPELADFLTNHIQRTIESWDERDMAYQIELNIGRDLQKVRINGTLVGGFIGCLLYLTEIGIEMLH